MYYFMYLINCIAAVRNLVILLVLVVARNDKGFYCIFQYVFTIWLYYLRIKTNDLDIFFHWIRDFTKWKDAYSLEMLMFLFLRLTCIPSPHNWNTWWGWGWGLEWQDFHIVWLNNIFFALKRCSWKLVNAMYNFSFMQTVNSFKL